MNANISLKSLINFLKSKSINNFNELLKFESVLKNNITDWVTHVKISDETYTKNILYRNKDLEIILISWLPGQHSKLHSHPKNGCILKVLEGELHEVKVNGKKTLETNIKINQVSTMHDNLGKHIISNIGDKTAVSLHVYSPPNFYN